MYQSVYSRLLRIKSELFAIIACARVIESDNAHYAHRWHITSHSLAVADHIFRFVIGVFVLAQCQTNGFIDKRNGSTKHRIKIITFNLRSIDLTRTMLALASLVRSLELN